MAAGYHADIPQGFWRRITQHGLPPKWLGAWGIGALIQGTYCLKTLPFYWVHTVILGAVLVGSQLAFLAWLQRADMYWDTLILQLGRYRRYYDAD